VTLEILRRKKKGKAVKLLYCFHVFWYFKYKIQNCR